MPKTLEKLNLTFPPMPQTLLRAVELMHDPDGPAPEEVVAMIERDPAAAARLLRVANSAYYGQAGRIQDVERAVMVLGAVPVVGLIMSTGFAELRSSLDGRAVGASLDLIRHCIAAGFLARHLVQRAPGPLPHETAGETFVGGLLHDVGKLVLLYNYSEPASAFYTDADVSAEGRRAEERERFGSDHVEAGLYFVHRFHMPETLHRAVEHHHAPHAAEGDAAHAAALYAVVAANLAANALGFAFDAPLAPEALDDEPAIERAAALLGYADADVLLATLFEAEDDLEAYVGAVL